MVNNLTNNYLETCLIVMNIEKYSMYAADAKIVIKTHLEKPRIN